MRVPESVVLPSDLAASALVRAPIVASIRDHNLRYVWVSDALACLVDVPAKHIVGNDATVLPTGMRALTNPRIDQKVLRTGEQDRRFDTVIDVHGEIIDVFISTSLLVVDEQKFVFQVAHDVTSAMPNGSDVTVTAPRTGPHRTGVPSESRLDPITDAFNPQPFQEQAIESLALANHGGSLLLLDPGNLRTIVERFGIESGDLVLRRVAEILHSATRAQRDVIGRLNQDLLAVVMPGVAAVEARAVATRVRSVIAERPVRLFAEPMHVQVSIGVASAATGPELPFEQWRRAADEALYDAKRAGKDQIATRELR